MIKNVCSLSNEKYSFILNYRGVGEEVRGERDLNKRIRGKLLKYLKL